MDENVLKLSVMTVAQTCTYTKTMEMYTVSGELDVHELCLSKAAEEEEMGEEEEEGRRERNRKRKPWVKTAWVQMPDPPCCSCAASRWLPEPPFSCLAIAEDDGK